MEKALKIGACAGIGIGVLEYVYTTSWYQNNQTLYNAGAAGGIAFDVVVGGLVAAVAGHFIV